MYQGSLLLDSCSPTSSIINGSTSTNSLEEYSKSNISTRDTSCLALPNPSVEKNLTEAVFFLFVSGNYFS